MAAVSRTHKLKNVKKIKSKNGNETKMNYTKTKVI